MDCYVTFTHNKTTTPLRHMETMLLLHTPVKFNTTQIESQSTKKGKLTKTRHYKHYIKVTQC